jgi:hypothetical protein
MADVIDLYPGCDLRWIETSFGEIFVRIGTSGGRGDKTAYPLMPG